MTGSVFLYRSYQPAAPIFVTSTQVRDTMPADTSAGTRETGRMMAPRKQAPEQNPERFSGKLESVNTGCFSDGECFVVVGGKHVTAVWGWVNETVGSVKGVEGFGDFEQHIGANVDVYANKLADGSYTLYGNTEYSLSLVK